MSSFIHWFRWLIPARAKMPVRASRVRDHLMVFLGITGFVVMWIAPRYQPYSFIHADGSFYATTMRGLVQSLSLDQKPWQPNTWYTNKNPGYRYMDMAWSNVAVGKNGTWYPKHSFLMPLASLPFYILFGTIGILFFNALCVILLLFFTYLIMVRYASLLASCVVLTLTMTCGALQSHIYHFSLDIFSATLAVAGFLLLVHRRYIPSGLVLGLAIWTRQPLLFLILPLGTAFLWRNVSLRNFVRFSIAFSVPLLLAAISNTIMFGAPWITGYDRVLTVVNGVAKIETHKNAFTLTWQNGLHIMFHRPDTGILRQSPGSVAALLGIFLYLLGRQRILGLAYVVSLAAYFAFFVFFRYNNFRFFFAWQAMLSLPLAMLVTAVSETFANWGKRASFRLREVPYLGQVTGFVVVVVIVTGWYMRFKAPEDSYTLSNNITKAVVKKGHVHCDYFNLAHHKWECSRFEGRDWQMVGLSIRKGQCVFQGQQHRMIMYPHSPRHRSIMRFSNVPKGPLVLRYGLSDGQRSTRTCMEVSWAGQKPVKLCARMAGELRSHVIPFPKNPKNQTLVIAQNRQFGIRHLCIEGRIKGAR